MALPPRAAERLLAAQRTRVAGLRRAVRRTRAAQRTQGALRPKGVLSRLPERLDQALGRIERGDLTVTARASAGLEQRLRHLSRSIDRLVGAVVFAALLLVGALLYTNGERMMGVIGLALAILSLVWVLKP